MKELMPGDMMQSSIDKGEMNKEQLTTFVETVKAKENVRLLMNNLKTVAPEIYGAMVSFFADFIDFIVQFECKGLWHLTILLLRLQREMHSWLMV